MKTLLERAKPELIACLTDDVELYPNVVENVVKYLDSIYFVNQMTIEHWVTCRSYWYRVTEEISNHPWDFFEEN